MNLADWIRYGLMPAREKYHLSSGTLARIASRDMDHLVTREQFEAEATHIQVAGNAKTGVMYFARATRLRRDWEYHTLTLADPTPHPLRFVDAFEASDQSALLSWTHCLRRSSVKFSDTSLRTWYETLTRATISPDAFRGGLLLAGIEPTNSGWRTWWYGYRLAGRAYADFQEAQE